MQNATERALFIDHRKNLCATFKSFSINESSRRQYIVRRVALVFYGIL